jgi:hypothetical protein
MTVEVQDQDALNERVASVVNTLITTTDPRQVIHSLLSTAAELSQLVLKAGKFTPSDVAGVFGSTLVAALAVPVEEEQPRIQVVPAGVIDLSKHR